MTATRTIPTPTTRCLTISCGECAPNRDSRCALVCPLPGPDIRGWLFVGGFGCVRRAPGKISSFQPFLRPSSTSPWNGWTGSTIVGCWSRLATCRRQSGKRRIIANWKGQPCWRDSNKMVSAILGGGFKTGRRRSSLQLPLEHDSAESIIGVFCRVQAGCFHRVGREGPVHMCAPVRGFVVKADVQHE